jgi:hypothetical protein
MLTTRWRGQNEIAFTLLNNVTGYRFLSQSLKSLGEEILETTIADMQNAVHLQLPLWVSFVRFLGYIHVGLLYLKVLTLKYTILYRLYFVFHNSYRTFSKATLRLNNNSQIIPCLLHILRAHLLERFTCYALFFFLISQKNANINKIIIISYNHRIMR